MDILGLVAERKMGKERKKVLNLLVHIVLVSRMKVLPKQRVRVGDSRLFVFLAAQMGNF